jgi:hypothetical protein
MMQAVGHMEAFEWYNAVRHRYDAGSYGVLNGLWWPFVLYGHIQSVRRRMAQA